MHTYIHTYIHAYTHTHIYIYIPAHSWMPTLTIAQGHTSKAE